MVTRRAALRALASAALTAALACGTDARRADSSASPSAPATASSLLRPPVVSAATLAGMNSTTAHLDAAAVAAETIDPEELQGLLDDAGFSGGVERTFGGGTGAFSRVVARTLAFGTDAGARAYLAWLRDHVSEIIGTTQVARASDLPEGALAVRHLPDGCCPKEVPVYLVAWQHGTLVLSVQASGQRARVGPIVSIVRAFETEM